MKNIDEKDLKTCICLKLDKFDEICKKLKIEYSIEFRMVIFNPFYKYASLKKISEYFGVKEITELHVAGFLMDLEVWLVYKN